MEISLRKLEDNLKDYQLLYEWCQSKSIYEWFEQRPLSLDEIKNKYQKKIKDNKQDCYFIKDKDKEIGYVQIYNINDKQKEYDIFLKEEYCSQGYGKEIINYIDELIFQEENIDSIILRPFKRNIRAIKCYQKCGYEIIEEIDDKDTLGNKEIAVILKKEKPLIDIIIPVYNTPIEDLKRCLDSIENQKYKRYKMIIVDDGSNEPTKEFLNVYQEVNNKVKLINANHKGVSNARNTGIDSSKSKYIAFVDSDDSITESFLENSISLIEEYNLDIIIGGYNEIKNNQIIRVRKSYPGIHIYDESKKELFLDKLLSSKTKEDNKEIDSTPTGRIYTRLFKRKSINKLRFNTNIKMSEDTLFMIDYTYQASRIGIVDQVWYNYYINDYSISNATKKEEMIREIENFIKEIKIRKDKELNNRIIKAYDERIIKANNYKKEIEV